MYCKFIIISAILLCICTGTNCQTTTSQASTEIVINEGIEEFDKANSYCFQFTWLGPNFDNSSNIDNGTCSDLIIEKKLKNTPCRQPLVISFDGSPPDIDYLWEFHRERVLCKRSTGQSCLKYSYSFNNQLENVTYMCAKALTVDEGAETNGCYSQYTNGYEIRTCICMSYPGGNIPCNTAHNYHMSFIILLFSLIVMFAF